MTEEKEIDYEEEKEYYLGEVSDAESEDEGGEKGELYKAVVEGADEQTVKRLLGEAEIQEGEQVFRLPQ